MTLKERFDAHIARYPHLKNFDWYEAHWVWVATSGSEGERANLGGANLAQANLREAYLSGANLGAADLGGADLSGARGIIQFGPCPSRAVRIGYVVAHDPEPMVQLGCWWKPLSETLEEVREKRGDAYANLIQAAADALAYRQENGW